MWEEDYINSYGNAFLSYGYAFCADASTSYCR